MLADLEDFEVLRNMPDFVALVLRLDSARQRAAAPDP